MAGARGRCSAPRRPGSEGLEPRWQRRRDGRPLSAKVLTQRLRERDGFVRRTVLVDEPPKVVEYGLTDRGEAIRPVFAALAQWLEGAGAKR